MTFHLLLALAVAIALGRIMGRLARLVGQPPVIGEILAGIMLGPSLLGAVAPAVYRFVLPLEVVPALGAVANLAVVLYMFLVGLELNADAFGGRIKSTVVIAQAGIVVPFVLGVALAVYLYPSLAPPAVSLTHFALFFGVAMSITAFPVLARILADTGLIRTALGTRALACAAIADLTAWCVLAVIVGLVQASTERAAGVVLLTGLFVFTVLVVGRPVMARLARQAEARGWTTGPAVAALGLLFACAWMTHAIGVHAVIGAFLAGVIIPHASPVAHVLTRRLEPWVVALLLPAFFAFMGMKTEIGLVAGLAGWLTCGVIILAATLGKMGGTFAAARAVGLDTRQAAGLGILMNTRGLMELIVLNVGLELGVISPMLFTMMVGMALVTTGMTAPLLRGIVRVEASRV
jgi:Kef-type K+ transport system membrane component KefB